MNRTKLKSRNTNYRYALFFIMMVIINACSNKTPKVIINTELGLIIVELYPEKAPVTVQNFMLYIEGNQFENTNFYRTVKPNNQPNSKVKIEVIQGGLDFSYPERMLAPILHENTDQTGILHKDGVISMARWQPGTASSEFFICIGDQPELDFQGQRNPDGQGFAAFGKVIKGMDIVRQIQLLPDTSQILTPPIEIKNILLLNEESLMLH